MTAHADSPPKASLPASLAVSTPLPRVADALLRRAGSSLDSGYIEENILDARWVAEIAVRGLVSCVRDEWPTHHEPAVGPALAGAGGAILFEVRQRPGREVVLAVLGDAVVLVDRTARGKVFALAAAANPDAAAGALADVRRLLPLKVPREKTVAMTFWSYRHGPRSTTEVLDVSSWAEIAGNYAARTRSALAASMAPADASLAGAGKLALWLGPPGTGKTHALRALSWEHRTSLDIQCVLDPEVLLDRTDYIMALFRDPPPDRDELAKEEDAGRPRTRLIVLEDAGELLGADAKSRAGHGLARLLNLTDGLPGQAARARVLITTNEDVGRLHPAVVRPGRCSSLVRFEPLDESEARAWLCAHGVAEATAQQVSSATVAELFALARGEPAVGASPRRAGFATR